MKKNIFLVFIFLMGCSAVPAQRILATPTPIKDLVISRSGTATNPLVYDGGGQTVECIKVTGNWVVVKNYIVQGCSSHGIIVSGDDVVIENVIVRWNVTENGAMGVCGDGSDGVGSGIKGYFGAERLIVRNSEVYENCGEGIAFTRVRGGLIENNIVTDNFSVNIYVDNSPNVDVISNDSLCTAKGTRPMGIAIGEEFYAGWGSQRNFTNVIDNLVDGCANSFISFNSENADGMERNLVVRDNTFRNTFRNYTISLYETNQNVRIENNTYDKTIYVRYSNGVVLLNNVKVGLTMTVSPTVVRTLTSTPSRTVTATSTITPSKTFTATVTIPPSPTLVLWVCDVTPQVQVLCRVNGPSPQPSP